MEIVLLAGTGTTTGYMKSAGIYRIATELRSAGFTVQTLDRILACPEEYVKTFLDTVISESTLFLGISTTMLQRSNAEYLHNSDGYRFFGFDDQRFQSLVTHARSLNPKIKIVVGGSQVDPSSTPILKTFADYIDYCVYSQGEIAAVALANHLKFGDEIQYKEIDGFRFIDDTTYPVDNYDNLDIKYEINDGVVEGEVTTVEVARGCVFKCKFCTYNLIGKHWGDMIKTKRSLIAEFERNYAEHGITTYICADDTLNDSLEKVQFLHDVFTSLSFRPTFSGYFRLDVLAKFKEQARLLLESGVWSMNFGIETMDKKAGALMGKGMGADRVKEALAYLKEVFKDEVILTANFIIGLPGETVESMYATLEYLLKPDCPLHGSNFRPLNLSRHIKGFNSELFKQAERFGYVIDETTDYWTSPILDYEKAVEITNCIFLALVKRKNPHYKSIHTFYINRLLNIGYTKDEIIGMVRNRATADFSHQEVLRRTKLAHDVYFESILTQARNVKSAPSEYRQSKVVLPTASRKASFTPIAWHG